MKFVTGIVARLIYAVPLAVFGLLHLMNGSAMSGIVPAFLPFKVFWVYFTGLALIAAAISIIAKKYDKLAALLLGIMLALFAFLVHFPGVLNPETMQMSMPSFLKDLALAGAALFFSGKSES